MFEIILFVCSVISFLFFVFGNWSYIPMLILLFIAIANEIRKLI